MLLRARNAQDEPADKWSRLTAAYAKVDIKEVLGSSPQLHMQWIAQSTKAHEALLRALPTRDTAAETRYYLAEVYAQAGTEAKQRRAMELLDNGNTQAYPLVGYLGMNAKTGLFWKMDEADLLYRRLQSSTPSAEPSARRSSQPTRRRARIFAPRRLQQRLKSARR